MSGFIQAIAAGLLVWLSAAGSVGAEPAPAPGYGAPDFEVPRAGTYDLPVLGKADDAVVLDTRGSKVTLYDNFGDGVAVLSFVYANCADAGGCPLAHFVMRKAAAAVLARDDLREHVRFVSLSFDPSHDTPAEMSRLSAVAPVGAKWSFLTTASESEIAPILAAYGQSITRERNSEGRPSSQIAHVLRVFLIDGGRNIRNIYSSSFLHAATLIADIETVLAGTPKQESESTSSQRFAGGESTALDLVAGARAPGEGLAPVPEPEGDLLTAGKVALGRKLFFDRRLSRNGTVSCAMCHVPAQGFTHNEMATPVGIEGRSVRRNAPSLYNVAYMDLLFHDARESRLEQQVWGPLLANDEMGNPSVGFVIDTINALPDYRGRFEAVFDGLAPSMETLGRALAAYERTLVSGSSAFDRWRYGGEEGALDREAQEGFVLFTGKAKCGACHLVGDRTALFTDQSLHDTGIGYRPPGGVVARRPQMQVAPGQFVTLHPDAGTLPERPADLGRYEISGDPIDRWKFKTPSLRNVALSAPYMHDGSLRTLEDVIAYYNRGGVPHKGLDPLL
ncbi:MAG: photosynthetic protein synthase I, partial [Myxococcales bacterium]